MRRTGPRARCAADGSRGYVARCGGLSTCAKPSNATEFVAEYLSSRKSQSLFATVCESTRFVLPLDQVLPTPPSRLHHLPTCHHRYRDHRHRPPHHMAIDIGMMLRCYLSTRTGLRLLCGVTFLHEFVEQFPYLFVNELRSILIHHDRFISFDELCL